jgi:mannosyltransferase
MRMGLPLAVLIVVAAALRLPGLGSQSFWHDEIFTVRLADADFGGLVDGIGDTEATPPVYYVVVWVAERLFGDGETGLRLLSALCGIALVPVAYAMGRALSGRRAGLIAAALVAVSPYLLWYSQEARSYALYALLSAASFLFFMRALERASPRALVAWAVLSALAIATHYFAGFIVGIEAVWLLLAVGRSRAVLAAVGAVAATCAVLAPLLLAQRSSGRVDWIEDTSLVPRATDTAKRFVTGPFGAPVDALAAASAALVLCALVTLFVRAGERERARAKVALAVALGSIAVPFVLAIGGFDYFYDHYVIAALVPLLCVVAVGIAAAPVRWAIALGSVLCALLASVAIAQQLDEDLQREDWREVSELLGPPADTRVIVADESASKPLEFYLGATPFTEGERAARELALVESFRTGHTREPPPPDVPGFALTGRYEGPAYRLITYRASAPVAVTPASAAQFGLDDEVFVLQG